MSTSHAPGLDVISSTALFKTRQSHLREAVGIEAGLASRSAISAAEICLLVVVYLLHILIVTAPIGFVIAAYKVYCFKISAEQRGADLIDQEQQLIATHYQWLMRTLIFTVLMLMAAVGLAYYFVGFVIGGIAIAWWLYRLTFGFKALLMHQMTSAIICAGPICYGQKDAA